MDSKIYLEVISGRKVLDRWGIDEKQFVFILLRDELRAAIKYDWSMPHEYESGRDHLFQTFVFKYRPLAGYTFSAQDVHAMEDKYPALVGGNWKEKVISVRELKDNWGLEIDEVENVIDNSIIKPVDPNGDEINPMDISSLIGKHRMIKVDDLLYLRSEIALIEKQYSIKRKTDTSKKRKPDHRQMQKDKCRAIAKKLWDQEPETTIVDMSIHHELIEHTKNIKGKLYTERTVREWIKDLCPNRKPGRRPEKK